MLNSKQAVCTYSFSFLSQRLYELNKVGYNLRRDVFGDELMLASYVIEFVDHSNKTFCIREPTNAQQNGQMSCRHKYCDAFDRARYQLKPVCAVQHNTRTIC